MMNLKAMNDGLKRLCEKYAIPLDGEITEGKNGIPAFACRKCGKTVRLLPWRVERRFVELKNLVDGKTLEDVSTLRFACIDGTKSLEQLLFRELDLCEFLGESNIVRTFAVLGGTHAANVLVKLADGKSVSVECSNIQPDGKEPMDRHEIIARRGVACDRVVDTQVPQSSIYMYTGEGEERYTDTDTELFGMTVEEITGVRAAFALLKDETLAAWQEQAEKLDAKVTATLASAAAMKPAIFTEEK